MSSEDDLSPESDSEAMEVDLLPQGMISHCIIATRPLHVAWLVSVPDPKPTPARITSSIARYTGCGLYVPDEVWGRRLVDKLGLFFLQSQIVPG